jgi:hypothetical protein
MRPTFTEQLDGVRRILVEVVAPEVTAAYPADVLAGAIATLETLAGAYDEVPRFLRWDADATAAVLATAGIDVDDVPDESLDERQRRLREQLEQAVPTILDHPDGRAAMIELFRERADRYPFAMGGPRAHAPR